MLSGDEVSDDGSLALALDLPDADDCVYGDLFDDSDFSFDDEDECEHGGGGGGGGGAAESNDNRRQANTMANANLNQHTHATLSRFDNIDEPIMDGRMSPKKRKDGLSMNLDVNENSGTNTNTNGADAIEQYILGTLIVRVAAARDLKAVSRGRKSSNPRRSIFRGAYANQPTSSPYSKIAFGSQVQRTSTVYDTINPSWPRSDQSFFDVTLPVPNLAQENTEDNNNTSDPSSPSPSPSHPPLPPPPKPILTVSIFHTDLDVGSMKNSMKMQDFNDEFLGLASIDVTPVLTGKTPCMDHWLLLGGADDDDFSNNSSASSSAHGNSNHKKKNRHSSSSVRVIIEYEAAESPPRQGDLVRFTGFVNPLDLFPLPNSHVFRVEEVMGSSGNNHNSSGNFQGEDEVILSYYTSVENWKCTFQVHRYMLISVERHMTALERYQEELLELTDKLAHSPAAEVVSNTMRNLPEEGILVVGFQAAFGSMSLMGRWMSGGIGTAIDDIIYATNLDGKHTSSHDLMMMDGDRSEHGDISMSSSIATTSDVSVVHGDDDNLSYVTDDVSVTTTSSSIYNPNMPCCPISGQPMRDPVVAADGHTYERKSILRWFRDSDMSPLTGTKLLHKELVPNFLLISTFSGTNERQSEESSQITQC